MRYYKRRRRDSGDPVLDLMRGALTVVLSVAFIGAFIWFFSRPGMWDFSRMIAAPTPTPVPAPASPNSPAMGVIAFLALGAVLSGAIGLFLLGLIWLAIRLFRRPRPAPNTSPAVTSFASQISTSIAQAPQSPAAEQQQTPAPVPGPSRPEPAPAPIRTPLPQEEKLDVEAQRLLKRFEESFFWALRHAFADEYYIFPQVPLRELMPDGRWVEPELSGMLYKGVVDFVLADPVTLQARLACEFDDPSHNLPDSRARDRRKDKFLRKADLPLARFPSGDKWDVESIRSTVRGAILPGCAVDLLDEREKQYFHALREARGDLFIFPRIALKSLVHRRAMLPLDLYKIWENETVDLVLAHPKYLRPIAVIDLCNPPSREKHTLLDQAGFPIVHFDGAVPPPVAELRAEIDKATHRGSARSAEP